MPISAGVGAAAVCAAWAQTAAETTADITTARWFMGSSVLRADAALRHRASGQKRPGVVGAFASAVCRRFERERSRERRCRGIYAIAYRSVVLRPDQDTGYGARCNIHHIVKGSATVGKAGVISRDETQPLGLGERSW